MHLKFKTTSARIDRPAHHKYNKHEPDVTISKNGLEYDMNTAPIYAYYASERLAEVKNKHETLSEYDHDLAKDANYHPQFKMNAGLNHARSVKVDRHRMLGLPQLLF
jgi:predicted ATP-binding protein involved in virulence